MSPSRVVLECVESQVLKDNPLGDPPVRRLPVVLPPGYDDDPLARFPTVYLLAGDTVHATLEEGRRYVGAAPPKNPTIEAPEDPGESDGQPSERVNPFGADEGNGDGPAADTDDAEPEAGSSEGGGVE